MFGNQIGYFTSIYLRILSGYLNSLRVTPVCLANVMQNHSPGGNRVCNPAKCSCHTVSYTGCKAAVIVQRLSSILLMALSHSLVKKNVTSSIRNGINCLSTCVFCICVCANVLLVLGFQVGWEQHPSTLSILLRKGHLSSHCVCESVSMPGVWFSLSSCVQWIKGNVGLGDKQLVESSLLVLNLRLRRLG